MRMKKHNMLKCLTLSACMLAGSVLPAVALEQEDFNFRTTAELYHLCSVPEGHGDYVAASYGCRGFIAGAVQYHNGVSDAKNLKRLICYPEGTTLEDGKDVFVKWGKAHENDAALMGEVAVMGLVKALADKYPCSAK